jgi:hypothetical protein
MRHCEISRRSRNMTAQDRLQRRAWKCSRLNLGKGHIAFPMTLLDDVTMLAAPSDIARGIIKIGSMAMLVQSMYTYDVKTRASIWNVENVVELNKHASFARKA